VKILIRQFLSKNHSWSQTGWGLGQAVKQLGYELHLFSTDGSGKDTIPIDLKSNLIGYTEENKPKIYGRLPDPEYDCQISYTCMKNFSHLLANGKKNRFGIWVYEWSGKNAIPSGFAKHYQDCDMMCVPSHFGKQIFMDSGIPENRMKVIPHGINRFDFEQTTTITLPTNKSCKIGVVIGQNHLRKNISGLLEAYGKAFTKNDDVCLVLKAKDRPIQHQFDLSLRECLNNFYRQFPQHAQLILLQDFIPDMSAFYRSIDIMYSLSNCEGFLYPMLEGLCAGKVSVAPKWGGQLDFLNDSNALLVEGKEVRANPKSMYWESKNSIWFQPSIDSAIDHLRYACNNFQTLNASLDKQRSDAYNRFDWKNILGQFLELCT
jgi:O-antigen biosynthesis alpha-1,2-mannosyltransferase